MQQMTGKKSVVVELPFLIKYWWASFVVIGFIAIIYQFKIGVTIFAKLYTKYYSMIFTNVLYQDLIAV